MFSYKKLLWYPINIKNKDLRLAKVIVTQYGGPYALERENPDVCHQDKISVIRKILLGFFEKLLTILL